MTVQEVIAHPWFQGQTATKAEMKQHYYKVNDKNMEVDIKKNEALKAEFSQSLGVSRSNADYKGASEEEVAGW